MLVGVRSAGPDSTAARTLMQTERTMCWRTLGRIWHLLVVSPESVGKSLTRDSLAIGPMVSSYSTQMLSQAHARVHRILPSSTRLLVSLWESPSSSYSRRDNIWADYEKTIGPTKHLLKAFCFQSAAALASACTHKQTAMHCTVDN